MSNFAKIVATTSGFSEIDSGFTIRFENTARSILIDITWSCKALRTAANQYTQGINANDQGFKMLSAVATDISNNASLSPYINTETGSNAFQLVANEFGWTITEQALIVLPRVTFVETPEVLPVKDFQLTSFVLSTATIPCTNIRITMSENDGVAPYVWIDPANASTLLFADIARGASDQLVTVILEDSEADQASLANVSIPRLFTAVEIDEISVVTNTGGLDATVTVFMLTQDFGVYQYSLDGSSFQTSNVFTGVLEASYTLWVQDGYGCLTSEVFTVDLEGSIQRRDAEALVPTANSMRMVQRVTKRFNTLENTLYQDEFFWNETQLDYKQLYQTNDGLITTQFRSNYDTLVVNVVDCEGSIIQTPAINQKSNNLDSRDTRDCNTYNFGNNQTGIFFTEGNTYEPGTTTINGEYTLLGKLPDWGVVGNTVTLSGGVVGGFLIKQVTFDPDIRSEVLIIDNVWTSGDEAELSIADVTYDLQNYETYEFDVDLSGLDGVYSNVLTMTDSLAVYPELIWDAETYKVSTLQKKTIWLDYYDSPGAGIDYSTGYQGHVRLRGKTPEANQLPGGNAVAFADSGGNIQKVKDSPTMSGKGYFEAQPRCMIEKLRLIVAHKHYFINGLEYQNEDEFEVEQVTDSSLHHSSIVVQRVGYEAYKTDNINVDGLV